MNGWLLLALMPIVLYLAGAMFVLRREDPAARRAWWQPVLRDPVAIVSGVVVGSACVTGIVMNGELIGLPSAVLMAVTAAALVGRLRARRTSVAE